MKENKVSVDIWNLHLYILNLVLSNTINPVTETFEPNVEKKIELLIENFNSFQKPYVFISYH